MELATYLLLASAGMGFTTGNGLGVSVNQSLGSVALHARGEVLLQDKVESPGWRYGGVASLILGRKKQMEGGASWRQTKTVAFTKTAWSPFVGIGMNTGKLTIRGRYYLPDNTLNKTDGVQVQLEARTKPYFMFRAGYFRFEQGGEHLTDEMVSVGVGWSWK